jgi:hypothetical protein
MTRGGRGAKKGEERTKRDFSLREPTLSQERKGRKKRRLAPFEMTGKKGRESRTKGREISHPAAAGLKMKRRKRREDLECEA